MVRAGAPKPMWADAIEFEAYTQSNTAWDIYMLQGGTPQTVMSGDTSNISQFVSLVSTSGSCFGRNLIMRRSLRITPFWVGTWDQQLMWGQ